MGFTFRYTETNIAQNLQLSESLFLGRNSTRKSSRRSRKMAALQNPVVPTAAARWAAKTDRSLSGSVNTQNRLLLYDSRFRCNSFSNFCKWIFCASQLTSLKRPLVVIHDLFDKSIMDISWWVEAALVYVCSLSISVLHLCVLLCVSGHWQDWGCWCVPWTVLWPT